MEENSDGRTVLWLKTECGLADPQCKMAQGLLLASDSLAAGTGGKGSDHLTRKKNRMLQISSDLSLCVYIIWDLHMFFLVFIYDGQYVRD